MGGRAVTTSEMHALTTTDEWQQAMETLTRLRVAQRSLGLLPDEEETETHRTPPGGDDARRDTSR